MSRTRLSIGEVLDQLRGDFPGLNISKIRFLEAEGLIAPQRAPSGYRRYADTDVARLRYILSVQAEHYLPLKVIREHLEMMDRGMQPPQVDSLRPVATTLPATTPSAPVRTAPDAPGAPPAALRLSRVDLLEASGLADAALAELERMQIVVPRRGTQAYGRHALALARAAKKLAEYGVDSRHLRAFKLSADREAGLLEQAIAPHQRRAGGSRDVAAEVTQLVIDVHAALIRSAMER